MSFGKCYFVSPRNKLIPFCISIDVPAAIIAASKGTYSMLAETTAVVLSEYAFFSSHVFVMIRYTILTLANLAASDLAHELIAREVDIQNAAFLRVRACLKHCFQLCFFFDVELSN